MTRLIKTAENELTKFVNEKCNHCNCGCDDSDDLIPDCYECMLLAGVFEVDND